MWFLEESAEITSCWEDSLSKLPWMSFQTLCDSSGILTQNGKHSDLLILKSQCKHVIASITLWRKNTKKMVYSYCMLSCHLKHAEFFLHIEIRCHLWKWITFFKCILMHPEWFCTQHHARKQVLALKLRQGHPVIEPSPRQVLQQGWSIGPLLRLLDPMKHITWAIHIRHMSNQLNTQALI